MCIKNIHGSSGVMDQVSSSIYIVQGMCKLKTELLDESSCTDPLFTSLMSEFDHTTNNVTELVPNVFAMGKTHQQKSSDKEHAALCLYLNHMCFKTNMKFISRLKYPGVRFVQSVTHDVHRGIIHVSNQKMVFTV